MASFLSSCNEKPVTMNGTIYGKWQLTEILMDPGDGSGVFQSVNSEKTVVFNYDESYECQGNLCMVSEESVGMSNGTFDTLQKLIFPESCGNQTAQVTYKIENDELIITYSCFEGCQEKYKRL